MREQKTKFSIILSILAMLSCLIFACFNAPLVAHAATFSSPNVELKLVGYQGYNPTSYFDSLSQTKIISQSEYYLNSSNNSTNQYYVVAPNVTHLFGARSTGTTSIMPFSDYISLANSNVLYAYGKTGIVAPSGEKNKVVISLQHNNQTKSAINSYNGGIVQNVYQPYYYNTESIKVVSNKEISFSFSNNADSNVFSPANFRLFEPSIVFKTKIDSVSFTNTDKTTYNGDIVRLNASNSVLDIASNTSLISYYKTLHKIEYEIIQGSQYASVIGNYLYFTGENSGTVKIRAKSLAESDSNTYVYSSNIVTYNYISEKKNITVNQNFSSGANITGLGEYYVGQSVSLIASENAGYTFAYWILNGEQVYSKSLFFVCGQNNQIELYTIKDIQISEIKISDKYYDGTTDANIENIILNGIQSHHSVSLTQAQAKYYSTGVGTKTLGLTITPTLEGTDSIWYNLSTNMPTIYGNILPKPVTLKILPSQKTYGEVDTPFEYEEIGILQGESTNPTLFRQTGESVGNYRINANTFNPNYNVTIETDYLTISPKSLTILSQEVSKVYDGTTDAEFSPTLIGIAFNDNITALIEGNFADKNVADNIVVTFDYIEFFGDKKHNYTFDFSSIPFSTGNITAKDVFVRINNATKTYGDSDPNYTYSFDGLVFDDSLFGYVQRSSNENVGTYALEYIGQNLNYNVINNLAYLSITPKNVIVYAEPSSKIYGEVDPIFPYQITGLVGSDVFEGALQRASGESAGAYDINIGTIKNSNYSISFVKNSFTITKRPLQGSITFNSKVYDGTTSVTGYSYNFTNLVSTDQVSLTLNADFASKNVGQNILININSYELSSNNYSLETTNHYANITRRQLTLSANSNSKVYGEQDTPIQYIAINLVSGDEIVGSLTRTAGENVGSYQILLGSINNQNNSNYNIVLNSSSFTIIKRTIQVKALSLSKFYNSADPINEFELTAGTTLAFDDVICDVISGKPARTAGENPGIYPYSIGTLYVKDNNYNVMFTSFGQLTIRKIDITVMANAHSKTYGDSEPYLTYTTNIEPVSDFNFELTRQQGETVGTYAINYLYLFNEFYNITYTPAIFTITPRNLVLRADNKIKYYGSQDPVLTYSIVSGILVNNDNLTQIITGNMLRTAGENLGTYEIDKGTLTISNNYTFDFIIGTLTVYKQDITVVAHNLSKEYSSLDPILTFEITKGQLGFNDTFTGSLTRDVGEALGGYHVKQGTLSLNQNYNISFVCGIFTITKANIIVSVPTLEKVFGNYDPLFTYSISGNFKQGDTLQGEISRATGENVGDYSYISSLSNSNYNITYNMGKFTIISRVLRISAKSYTITYGEQIPTLEYTIDQGSSLENDVLSGGIYKVAGSDAGTYDINSTLSLGRNYKIEYTKGTLTILPIELKLSSLGKSKIYGQSDPVIEYQVSQGEILPGDNLQGFVSREEGSDVGIYSLVPSFANKNYSIEIISGVFEIKPKEATLHATAMDKVYDGTDKAYILQPIVLGLIDSGITIYYDAENVATFQTKEVADNIDIYLYGISLVGEKASNYTLILPVLKANITHSTLISNDVEIHALSNTELTSAVNLVVTNVNTFNKTEIPARKTVLKEINIALLKANHNITVTSNLEVNINLNDVNYQNVKVYLVDENGNFQILQSTYKNGLVTFETDTFGNIVIVADDLNWLDIQVLLSFVALFGIAAWFIISKISKTKKI